ncbi:MAG: NrfD/PsrC family molybdoenzyme membrane anchor subunit [Candidatus Korobacteraceae bacterium]
MATSVTMQRDTNDRPWVIGLGVLVVIGIIAWIVQLALGFDVLGVGQSISWGAYIAVFFLLAGAGSGLVILAALGDLGAFPELKEHRRSALIAALGCYVAAGVTVLMDVGKPLRALSMIYSPNFKSMFVWDFYLLALSIIVAAVYLYRAPTRSIAGVAAAAATLLMIVEGWILTVSAGTSLWHSSLIPVEFLIEGLLTALCLLLLKHGADGRVGEFARKGVVILLPVVFALSFVEMVAVLYGADAEAAAAMKLLAGGSLAPLYWGALILGVVIPFVLLVRAGGGVGTLRVAAVLTIAGIFSNKLNLLVAGRAIPFMQPEASYTPSVVEIGGVIGVLGLAALLFVLGKRFLPVSSEA